MARLDITAADRDTQGRIRVGDPLEPRSLADLLPPPAASVPLPPPPPDEARPADAPPTLKARLAGALAALGVVVGLALVIIGSHGERAAAPAPPRSAPTAVLPTAVPSPTTQAAHMIVAYWAPNGAAVPEPVAERDAYHFVGKQGDDWAQVQLPGGGLVWVRLADLHPDPVDLEALARVPDLTPPTPAPAPPPVYVPPVVEQPAQEAQTAPAPTATPLTVPPMRFPPDAPEPLPSPQRVHERPSGKAQPGVRPYGARSPLQPPAAIDQPQFGAEPTEAPAPADT